MPAAKTGTIEHWRHGIVTRGVLYDIPRLRGVDYVVPGEPVHGWELADAAAAQGVTPAPGDAVLIRCGADAYFRQTGGQQTFAFPAGVHASAVEFLYETEAALLCLGHARRAHRRPGHPEPRRYSGPAPRRTTSDALHGHAAARQRAARSDRGGVRGGGKMDVHAGRGAARRARGNGSPVNPIGVL